MKKNVVICGANRGIGLALATHLCTDANVFALCRTASAELKQIDVTAIDDVDVTNADVLAKLPARLKAAGCDTIDVLIHNAGVLSRQSLDNLNEDALEDMRWQFEVNTLGPLRTVNALRSMFGQAARLAIITSRMGSMADNTSGGQYGYRISKAGVNMVGRSLAVDLAEQGVAVALIHPGYVRTDMTGGNGLIDTDESAAGICKVIDNMSVKNSGSFWHCDGSELPW
ncbi:MAG: SDR family oxidoreductase [Gammaproteobacteria bacterium]